MEEKCGNCKFYKENKCDNEIVKKLVICEDPYCGIHFNENFYCKNYLGLDKKELKF